MTDGFSRLWRQARRRLLDASALALATGLWGVFYLPRLPSSADFILPRHAAWPLFRALIAASDSRAARAAASVSAVLLAVLAAGALLLDLWDRRQRYRPDLSASGGLEKAARLCCCLAGWYLLGRAARFALTVCLDVIQNVWFVPESVSLAEPAATWLVLASVAVATFRAAAALGHWAVSQGELARELAGEWASWAAAIVLPAAVLYGCGAWAWDASKASLAQAAGFPPSAPSWREVVLLTENDGKPGQDHHLLEPGRAGELDDSPERLAAVERYLDRGPTVYLRPGLRYLYAGYTLEMEAEKLRRALARGHRAGDVLARVLLLESLACAPVTAENRALLDSLADEARYRVGPKGAARVAAARAHLEATFRSGAVAGRVSGLKTGRVGLYCRKDRYSPYALGPAQLVAAAALDRGGRFRFQDLAAGDYFLALTSDSENRPRRPLELRGHRGDFRLDARRPRAQVHLTAR